MIQRLQSLFLAMAILFNLGAFFTPVYERAMEDPQLWIGIGLASSLLIALLLDGYAISLFKNRKKQMSWLKRASLFQIIAFGFSVGVIFSLGGFGTYLWDEALGTGLVLMGFISQILALQRIRKDEELVKSMDRIR